MEVQYEAYSLALGALYGVRTTSIPLLTATRLKFAPNLLSLSLIKYFGASLYGVASRTLWVTHMSVGDRVTPKCTTRRVLISMMKKTNSGLKMRSYTGRKSQAQTWSAWLRKNVDQF